MIAFVVEPENRPGSAAEVTEAIAERGINVTGAAGVACGSTGQVALTTNDEAGTRRALLGQGFKFREVEVVPVTIADSPGTFAQACRALADASINVEAAFGVALNGDRITLAFATDDPVKARSILGQRSFAGSSR
jgi:hypothetical protein